MQPLLSTLFPALAGRYTPDKAMVETLWREIQTRHSEPHRHYHTLAHLAHLYRVLLPVWKTLESPDAVLFALFYHDAVYNPQSAQNEEDSAVLACRQMNVLNVPAAIMERCERHVLATKGHQESGDWDTNLFTDADLSILGATWEEYRRYAKAVRAEYTAYNDTAYAAGRAKVLAHFLAMERIFKTEYFFEALERKARQNLERDIQLYI